MSRTCGYREIQGMAVENSPFKQAGINIDTWREDNTCSYCGGLNPEIALQRMENGEKVTPTDKDYKLYLGDHKVYFYDFTKEQKVKFIELHNNKKIAFNYPGCLYVMPYFCSVDKKG